MKKVLVTGASGFIGHHCLEPLLKRGYEVHAVTREPISGHAQDITRHRAAHDRDVTWHRADLMHDSSRLLQTVRPTHLLHLAWYVAPGKLISAAENFAWVTASMEMLRHFDGERVLICGSGYEYDWAYGYCSERLTPLVPNTAYGACKHALQVMAESMAQQNGQSFAWGRVFFVYGPREHPDRLVSSVIRSVLKGESAKCSHGRQIRDYMHVQDVADGLVSVLDSTLEGAVNVCSGQAATLRDIVVAIGESVRRPALIELGAIPARANDTPLVVGDNSRLKTETCWQQQFDLESGLRHTIDWWKQEL